MLRARTLAEANLYANLSFLLTGEGESVAPDGPEEGPEGWTLRYGQVEIFVPYASEAEARRSGVRFGPGVSELIDAGQWKLISAEYAHQTLQRDIAYSVEGPTTTRPTGPSSPAGAWPGTPRSRC